MQFLSSGKKSEKSDAELINAYKSNPQELYIEILFERYCHLAYAVSLKYLQDEDESKDMVLWAFEKLPSDLLKYEISNFSSWLHTVVKNRCYRVLSQKIYPLRHLENIPNEEPDVDNELIRAHLPNLKNAIEQLRGEQKKCVELFYLDGLSYQEVCEASGYTMNEVKSHIQNGKRNLKIILSKNNSH